MKKLIIIGAGGHARSVIDIFQQMKEFEIVGCLDPCFKERKTVEYMEEIPIIGDDSFLELLDATKVEYVFVAVGNNRLRKKLIEKVRNIGSLKLATAVSPNAYVSSKARIGEGTCVMAGAVLNVNANVGSGVIINTNSSVDHDCIIEDYVHVAPGTAISGSTVVREGAHIGTGSSVIDGIQVGTWSYVGAGAVVVKNIPSFVMVYGVPARIIKDIQ